MKCQPEGSKGTRKKHHQEVDTGNADFLDLLDDGKMCDYYCGVILSLHSSVPFTWISAFWGVDHVIFMQDFTSISLLKNLISES